MKDRGWLVVALVAAAVIVIAALFSVRSGSRRPVSAPIGSAMGPNQKGGMMTAAPRPATYKSNGERIYWTGADDAGKRASFEGGPSWLAMHGGSCVDCHGIDGRGGKPVMMGTAVPPDIRYGVLTKPEEHMDQPLYTDATIKRAITQGLEPGNGKLDMTMPRWTMPERDLDDLVGYLKQLDGGKTK
jgi:mono/diheme cytochrome c family protein